MRGRRSLLFLRPAGTAPATGPAGAADELAPFDAGGREEWWWRQVRRFRREWGLEVGSRVVALLRGERPLSRTSRARFAGAAYELRRGWRGDVEVRAERGAERLARFVPRWLGGGRIETPAGDTLRLVPIGFWRRTHELRTADEHVLVRLESHRGLARHDVRLELEDPARGRADLPLLLALAAIVLFAPSRRSQ